MAEQRKMFKSSILFRAVDAIPVQNDQLKAILGALFIVGLVFSPKIFGKKVKKGEGYMDMEAPEEIIQAREAEARKGAEERLKTRQ